MRDYIYQPPNRGIRVEVKGNYFLKSVCYYNLILFYFRCRWISVYIGRGRGESGYFVVDNREQTPLEHPATAVLGMSQHIERESDRLTPDSHSTNNRRSARPQHHVHAQLLHGIVDPERQHRSAQLLRSALAQLSHGRTAVRQRLATQ